MLKYFNTKKENKHPNFITPSKNGVLPTGTITPGVIVVLFHPVGGDTILRGNTMQPHTQIKNLIYLESVGSFINENTGATYPAIAGHLGIIRPDGTMIVDPPDLTLEWVLSNNDEDLEKVFIIMYNIDCQPEWLSNDKVEERYDTILKKYGKQYFYDVTISEANQEKGGAK